MTVGMVDCALCALSKNAAEQVAQELAAAKAEAGASLASLVHCVLRKKRSAYIHFRRSGSARLRYDRLDALGPPAVPHGSGTPGLINLAR